MYQMIHSMLSIHSMFFFISNKISQRSALNPIQTFLASERATRVMITFE